MLGHLWIARQRRFVCNVVLRTFVLVFVALWLTSVGCTTSAQIGESKIRVNDDYTESRFYYVSNLADVAPPNAPEPLPHCERLLTVKSALLSRGVTAIEPGAPVTVVAHSARLPREGRLATNVVVVVDVAIVGSDKPVEPLLVKHFENPAPGTQLPFSSLRVWSTETWDAAYPPKFRVRVINLFETDSQNLREALKQADKLASQLSFGPIVKDAAVSAAIAAADAILKAQKNEVILDFEVQMYGDATVDASADTLPILRRGRWILLAKHRSEQANYWEQDFFIHDQSDLIYRRGDPIPPATMGSPEAVDMPYLSISVAPALTAGFQKRVTSDASTLLRTVTSPALEYDLDSVHRALDSAQASTAAFLAIERYRRAPSQATMGDLVALLRRSSAEFSDDGRIQVRERLRRAVPDQLFFSDDDILTWWETIASKGGSYASNGTYESPVQGWIEYVQNARSMEQASLAFVHLGELVESVRPSPASTANPSDSRTAAEMKFALAAQQEQSRKIVALVNQLRLDADSKATSFLMADEVVAWWDSLGSLGQLEVLDGKKRLGWRARSEAIAIKLRSGSADWSDVAEAVLWLTPPPSRRSVGQSAAKGEIASLSWPHATNPDLYVQAPIAYQSLLASLEGLAQVALSDDATVNAWWMIVGQYGPRSPQNWENPAKAWIEQAKNSGDPVALDRLRSALAHASTTPATSPKQLLPSQLRLEANAAVPHWTAPKSMGSAVNPQAPNSQPVSPPKLLNWLEFADKCKEAFKLHGVPLESTDDLLCIRADRAVDRAAKNDADYKRAVILLVEMRSTKPPDSRRFFEAEASSLFAYIQQSSQPAIAVEDLTNNLGQILAGASDLSSGASAVMWKWTRPSA